jgi:hypothetical protein
MFYGISPTFVTSKSDQNLYLDPVPHGSTTLVWLPGSGSGLICIEVKKQDPDLDPDGNQRGSETLLTRDHPARLESSKSSSDRCSVLG